MAKVKRVKKNKVRLTLSKKQARMVASLVGHCINDNLQDVYDALEAAGFDGFEYNLHQYDSAYNVAGNRLGAVIFKKSGL